jgi:hypothetical protein
VIRLEKIYKCGYMLCGKKIILCAESIRIEKRKVQRHQGHRGELAVGNDSAEAWIDREYTSSRSVPLIGS